MENKENKEGNCINNSPKYEDINKHADKLTFIANTLIFDIPIIIWCLVCVFSRFFNGLIVKLFLLITMLCIIVGITILIYIRIIYPDNIKSQKLVRTCIFATIAIALIYGFLYVNCIRYILSIKGCPG